jgi:formylglycine-generating enzyme required for sulfatase activity
MPKLMSASRRMDRAWLALLLILAVGPPLPGATAQTASERVRITTFAIDATEVSIGQFRTFLAATGRKTAAETAGGGFEYAGGWTRRPGWTWAAPYGRPATPQEPAVHVTWSEARDYCAHVGGALPTFEQWKLAAYTETRQAPTDGFITDRTYRYPVGDTPEGMNTSRREHVAVGTTKRGVNGLFEMGANVWEWLADRRSDEALTAGGSWWYGPENTTASGAQWKAADFYAVYIGFRCVSPVKG